jgi:hypothetical protein
MRPRNELARDRLPALLRRQPGARSADLAAAAGTSLPTLNRMLKEVSADIVRVGRAGRTRYYLRRLLKGMADDITVYRIDTQGRASVAGQLRLIAPEGCVLDVAAMGWPVAQEFAAGVWPGLPYPLQDMRPQGFLGRALAQQVAAGLQMPSNPKDWSDDDVLQVLMRYGHDCTGDLIVGDAALQRWLQSKTKEPTIVAEQALPAHYLQLAQNASASGLAGSSAAGEFPKFTALRELPGSATPHVIVKYSGQEPSATVQRWSDLLVCEHLALQAVGQLDGIQSARSRVLQCGGRTFLEIERFDRQGLHGRSPLCSLSTLEAAILDTSSDDWPTLGLEMVAHDWLPESAVQALHLITTFGRLIHNTDMHHGNLSLLPGPVMRLAPVYDMLPMAYAPLGGGELPGISYAPKLPMPQQQKIWRVASGAALAFWQAAATDARISSDFRQIGERNRLALQGLQAILA